MGDEEVLVSATPNYHHHALKVLQLLKDASHHFQTNTSAVSDSDSPTKLLAQIETELAMFLSSDPRLSTLSSHLSQLKVLVQTQEESKSKHRIRSFLTNKIRAHEISRLSRLIGSEIQAWIDRQNLEELAGILRERFTNSDSSTSSSSSSSNTTTSWEDEESLIIGKLSQLRDRLGRGFDIHFQDALLKSRIYTLLESLLGRASISKRVREMAAYTLKELVLFNKDVFVGQVLAGQTIKGLVTMGSMCGLDVLKSLIKAIKSPLVDELDSFGGILKIVEILGDDYHYNHHRRSSSSELGLKVMAIDCIMEIGYFGRKEAIESMLNEAGLIKKLVDLQRSELGGTLIEMEKGENNDNSNSDEEEDRLVYLSSRNKKEKKFLEKHPFASCVARFAVQLEVGEGLRQREKRAFKQEILKRVREASVSDAEAATIIAEVLWGSSPCS